MALENFEDVAIERSKVERVIVSVPTDAADALLHYLTREGYHIIMSGPAAIPGDRHKRDMSRFECRADRVIE